MRLDEAVRHLNDAIAELAELDDNYGANPLVAAVVDAGQNVIESWDA